jgi:carboxylesterase type B
LPCCGRRRSSNRGAASWARSSPRGHALGRILGFPSAAPVDRIRAGVAADIDLLIGTNTEETRLFLLPDGTIDRVTEEMVGDGGSIWLAAGGSERLPDSAPSASAGAIQTDWYWRIPGVRLADAHASNARGATYIYEFAWRSRQMDGRLGAAHSVEIPFVFDTLGLGTELMLGQNQARAVKGMRQWADSMDKAHRHLPGASRQRGTTACRTPWPTRMRAQLKLGM